MLQQRWLGDPRREGRGRAPCKGGAGPAHWGPKTGLAGTEVLMPAPLPPSGDESHACLDRGCEGTVKDKGAACIGCDKTPENSLKNAVLFRSWSQSAAHRPVMGHRGSTVTAGGCGGQEAEGQRAREQGLGQDSALKVLTAHSLHLGPTSRVCHLPMSPSNYESSHRWTRQ